MIGLGKLIKWEACDLGDDVVNRRFKGSRRVGDRNFIQRQADRNLAGNARDREAGRFGSQRRGTGNPRVDFNDIVIERKRIKRKLDVATAFNFQLANQA